MNKTPLLLVLNKYMEVMDVQLRSQATTNMKLETNEHILVAMYSLAFCQLESVLLYWL